MTDWHVLTSEYPPDRGGVSDYTRVVARALAGAGDAVHVWCPRPADDERVGAGRVYVHGVLGDMTPPALRRLDAELDAHPGPRRLLVQWVPHGYGYRSMNVWFCRWVAARARAGDRVELMVHEPFVEFSWTSVRHAALAGVHRVMTALLLSAATRVWVAIPAWERCLRPYALGRRVPMTWLPIPACLPGPERTDAPGFGTHVAGISADASGIATDATAGPVVGHFGTYGSFVTALLAPQVPGILDLPQRPSLLLVGAGSDAFRRTLVTEHPEWQARVRAAGEVPAVQVRALLDTCDVLVQPYPDGISSRRTTAMAGLSAGSPIVTTRGRLTESVWTETAAVRLAAVGDAAGAVRHVAALLADPAERAALGGRARALYDARFDLRHTIAALRAA